MVKDGAAAATGWGAFSLPASASLMPSAVALSALPQKSVVPSAR